MPMNYIIVDFYSNNHSNFVWNEFVPTRDSCKQEIVTNKLHKLRESFHSKKFVSKQIGTIYGWLFIILIGLSDLLNKRLVSFCRQINIYIYCYVVHQFLASSFETNLNAPGITNKIYTHTQNRNRQGAALSATDTYN